MVIGIIVRQGIKYIAQGLRYQDRIVNQAYSRPFLRQNFNRYAVKGIRHGLSGGAVAGGLYEGLYSPADDTPGNAPFSESNAPEARSQYKARGRRARRPSRKRCVDYRDYKRR